MMQNFLSKHHRVIFYFAWFLFSILQASFTELQDDEAYYWVYSLFPAWGYFDHPPLTAIMIKVGYFLFQNELGVRLVSLFMNFGTLLLLQQLTGKQKPFLFYTIMLSMAILQIAGFMAAPDIPLIFFTVLFFWVYKQFLERSSLGYTLLLGIVMALLLYSKYHGVLLIFFTILSNPKILLKPQFLLAAFIGVICFLPHLYWQYEHDFISFKYHLFESNVNPYKFSYTTEYIGGQILMAGPIAGIILIPAALWYRNKQKDKLIRALQFTLIGFYVFFLLSSFRGRVEANWTAPVVVPLVILSFFYLARNVKWEKALLFTLPFSIIIILLLRIAMVVDILPLETMKERFHSWKQWPQMMKQETKGLPIVWSDSYQRASKYYFYTGQLTHSVNWYQGRKNNYNYWPIEKQALNQAVYFMDIYNTERFPETMHTPIGEIGYKYDSSFVSFGGIQFKVRDRKIIINQDDEIVINTILFLDDAYKNALKNLDPGKFSMRLGIFQKNKWVQDIMLKIEPAQLVNANHFIIKANHQIKKGKYFMRIALQAGDYPPTHNSEKITLEIR